MKPLIVILLFPLQIFAQDITGLWLGFIHTKDKDLPYELAISENNGKLSGYTHTTFTVNGVPEVGVKAVNIENKNGKVLVEDEVYVFNDYSEAPVKGIRQFDHLVLIVEDTAMMLNGTFKTNTTRAYRLAIKGTIELRKTNLSAKTKIIPKLNELNLLGALSFLQPKTKEKEVVAIVPKAEEKITLVQSMPKKTDSTPIAVVLPSAPLQKLHEVAIQQPSSVSQSKLQVIAITKPKEIVVTQAPVEIKKSQSLPSLKDTTVAKVPVVVKKAQSLPSSRDTTVIKVIATKKPQILPSKETVVAQIPAEIKKTQPLPLPKEKVKEEVAVSKPVPVKKEQPVVASQTEKIVVTPSKQTEAKPLPVTASIVSAAEVTKRKTETIQSVYFKSDSLVLSLYDNGEVDGDTVSVVLNGKVILANQGLTTNAITKTIYMTPDLGDSLQLVMYAENLGSIPPNTGLLILQDGKDRYEIRFAGDFKKNSAVLLRRKKNQ